MKEIKTQGYEKLLYAEDKSLGFRAWIAIHSTALGPALGGLRFQNFSSEQGALQDVLRLSKAMTFKAAISGLPLGGGKAVLMGDPKTGKSKALFHAFGEMLESLHGQFIVAEDSGILPRDLNQVASKTSHVTGTSLSCGGSGDPSACTARGVLLAIQALAKRFLGSSDLSGLKVAVQGMGQVGWKLAKLLKEKQVDLMVSDLDESKCLKAKERLGAKVLPPEKLMKASVDIFSPCAFGSVLNPQSIASLRSKIVVGGANNQFENEPRDSLALAKRGIHHAPDYVVNAGGLIHLYVKEILKNGTLSPWIQNIEKTLNHIFDRSEQEKLPPLSIADKMVREKLSLL